MPALCWQRQGGIKSSGVAHMGGVVLDFSLHHSSSVF